MMETGTEAILTERIQSMSSDEAVKLIRELCAQLDSSGVSVHGNIWPGNVTFQEDGAAVLGEGSSAPVSEREAVQVEYLPPEYFWDNSSEATGDVYSLGMLLYASCNDGYLPFQPKGGALTDKDRSGALRKRMKGEAIPLPAGTSPQLGAVILKALAYEPEDRYQSAGELLTALSDTDEALPGAELAGAAAAAGGAAAAAAGAAEKELPSMTPERKYTVQKDFENDKKSGKKSKKNKKTAKNAPKAEPAAESAAAAVKSAPEAAAKAAPETPAKPAPTTTAKTAPATAARTGAASKGTTAAPATRKKKKTSPAIPILCVAALAVIGGAAWLGFNHGGELFERLNLDMFRHAEETPEISEPYVILPEESPDATAAPVPSSVEDEIIIPFETEEPTPTPEPTATPEPTPEPIVGSATVDGMDVTPADDIVVVTTSGTNLRSGPGTGYEVSKTLSRGIQMQRTGTVNGWSQVQYEGEEYYVSSNLVEVDEEAVEARSTETLDNGKAALPTPTPAPAGSTATPAPAATTPSPSTTPVVTDPGTPAITGTGGNSNSGNSGNSGNTASAAANVTATRDVISVTGSEVNLRTGPSTSSSVVTTVSSGTTLQRTGTVNGWSRVTYQGQEAYIIDDYISPVSDSTVSAGSGTAKVTSDVNVRSGANTDSSILGVATAGTNLTVTGITEGGKWYRVSYNGQEGYVNRKLISIQDFSLESAKSGTAKVTTYSNVRSGPGTGYSILGQVNTGDSLTVLGTVDNNWVKVSFNGQTGYIAGNLVNIS